MLLANLIYWQYASVSMAILWKYLYNNRESSA